MKPIRISLLALSLLATAAPLYAAEVSAVVDWHRRVTLSTPVSGVIEAVLVQRGDRVKQGQELLRLDARMYQAAVDRARAEVRRQEETLRESQRELERSKELYERTVLSDHELEIARIGFVTADAQAREARAGLAQAELNLEYSVIRAPFDGIVVMRSAEVGESVITRMQSVPLISIAETGRYLARARMSLVQIRNVQAGQAATVVVAGTEYQGRVEHVGLEPAVVKQGARLFDVDAVFTAADGKALIHAGQDAVLRLP